MLTKPQSPLLDVRPILERKVDSIWTRAEKIRDDLYDNFLQACAEVGIEALVLKSGPLVHPAWVKFECWVPKESRLLTERSSAIITIEPKPYHRYEFEYHLELQDRGKKEIFKGLREFTRQEVSDLVLFLLHRGPKPNYRPQQLRQAPFELWKPKNKIDVLEIDWIGKLPAALFILGFLLIQAQIWWLLWIIAAFLQVYLSRRPIVVRSSGKPAAEPRALIRVDSWQTVIFGMGGECQTVRERFLQALERAPTENFRYRSEQIWYWGLDGKEEREQLVLSMGRGILFCQIHPYGKELYVGWDAYLNTGQWVERVLAKGIDRVSGQLVSINVVVPGTQRVTEYDVTDLSCLIEWTHAQIVKLLKQFIEERKIDQEIDFKILRGERQHLTEEGKPEGVAGRLEQVTKTLRNPFKRTG